MEAGIVVTETSNGVGEIITGSKVVYNGITYDVGECSASKATLYLNNKKIDTVSVYELTIV